MATVSISGLEKAYGARTLFSEVDLTLTSGRRYGLVGANGSGKSTLLRILARDDVPSDGTIGMPKSARLGVLRQDRFLEEERLVIDLAMDGDEEVVGLLREQARLVAEGKGGEAAELEERVRLADGYTLEARAAQILEGLGIQTAAQRRPLRTLSGGFKLRVLLAQVLLGRPDVLLLDEPTNHLDILSIRWLEKFLGGYEGCAVVVSHDRRFLDNVVTHVLDVDFETVLEYPGNYTTFEQTKASMLERKEAENARLEEIIAEKKAFVERFRAKATKARQAQSRLKQIEKIEVEEIKPTSRRAPKLKFEAARPSGRDVLTAEGIDKAYGDKSVLRGVGLGVRRGERVAIIGANGLGKSTLVRILAERLEADHGEITWGHEVRLGYFPQDHKELFPDPNRKVLDYLWDLCPLEGTSFVRGQLGRALFSGSDVDKTVTQLSGGEAARLLFARIAVEKPNVLLLDEPTNHLDFESTEALADAIREFDGTVILVSHNRWLVSELATRVVEVKADGVVDFPGSYQDYLARSGDDHLDAEVVLKKAKEDAKRDAPKDDGGWEEQKRRRNRLKSVEARLTKVNEEVEATESRLRAIRTGWGEDGFYERTPAAEVTKLQEEEKALSTKADTLVAEWEKLELEIAELRTALGI